MTPSDLGDVGREHATVESHLSCASPAIARRIRALRRADTDWTMRTSELMSSAVRRVLLASESGRVSMGRSGFWSLVDTIVRNLLVDRFRRRRVRRIAFERICAEKSQRVRGCESSGRAPFSDEDRAAAERVLVLLTPPERELAQLRMKGARWSDIARVLRVTEEAARQRWTTLRRRVQQRVRDDLKRVDQTEDSREQSPL